MVVVVLVGDDEHPGVAAAALHVLPRRAVLDAAAPVVSPWMRRAFDGFLAVFPPGVIVRRYIRHLVADRRHPHHPLLPRLLLLGAVASAVGVDLALLAASRRLRPGRRRRRGIGHGDELAADGGEEGRRGGARRVVVEAEADHLRLLAPRRHLHVELLLLATAAARSGLLLLLELDSLPLLLLLLLLIKMLVELDFGGARRKRRRISSNGGGFRGVDLLHGGRHGHYGR